MTAPRRRQSQGNRRRTGGKQRRVDIWRSVPQMPDPAPIAPPDDATALLRSLGDPPLQGQGAAAEHYLAAVIERAAGLATGLAAAAGLLATPDDADAEADAEAEDEA
jgi:hypothetical protein